MSAMETEMQTFVSIDQRPYSLEIFSLWGMDLGFITGASYSHPATERVHNLTSGLLHIYAAQ